MCHNLAAALLPLPHTTPGSRPALACLPAGHYVALVRTPCGQWVCFDDEQVNAITEAQVQSVFGHTQDWHPMRDDQPGPHAGEAVRGGGVGWQWGGVAVVCVCVSDALML